MTEIEDDEVRVHHVHAYQVGPVREDNMVVMKIYIAESEMQYAREEDGGFMGMPPGTAIEIAKRLVASVEALQTGMPFEYAPNTTMQ